jgi:hypothetical protein
VAAIATGNPQVASIQKGDRIRADGRLFEEEGFFLVHSKADSLIEVL